MPEFSQDLSLQDLRAIIHGLKIAGFSSIEDGATDIISFRIRALPSAEMLAQLSENPKSLKQVTKEVGEIMRLIEIYSKKDMEFKSRFKSKKKLPPRYKVLNWEIGKKPEGNITEVDFNKERDMNKMDKAACTKEIVKLSSIMDERGQTVIANKLLKCAKSVTSNEDISKEFNETIELMKKAGMEDEITKIAGPIWEGVKNLGKGVGQKVKEVAQTGKEMFQVGKYEAVLKDIGAKIDSTMADLDKAIQPAQEGPRKVQMQTIKQKLSQMKQVGDQIYNLVRETETATAPQAAPQTAPQTAPQAAPQAAQGGPTAGSKNISGNIWETEDGSQWQKVNKVNTASSKKWIRIV